MDAMLAGAGVGLTIFGIIWGLSWFFTRGVKHTPLAEPPQPPELTSHDALLAIVEATGNRYHPSMTVEDVSQFVRMVCDQFRGTRTTEVVYVHSDDYGSEVFRLECYPPGKNGGPAK